MRTRATVVDRGKKAVPEPAIETPAGGKGRTHRVEPVRVHDRVASPDPEICVREDQVPPGYAVAPFFMILC